MNPEFKTQKRNNLTQEEIARLHQPECRYFETRVINHTRQPGTSCFALSDIQDTGFFRYLDKQCPDFDAEAKLKNGCTNSPTRFTPLLFLSFSALAVDAGSALGIRSHALLTGSAEDGRAGLAAQLCGWELSIALAAAAAAAADGVDVTAPL